MFKHENSYYLEFLLLKIGFTKRAKNFVLKKFVLTKFVLKNRVKKISLKKSC